MVELLSLNIEGDNHFDTVLPLVAKEKPELIFFNEVFASDVIFLQDSFHMDAFFVPAAVIAKENSFRMRPRGEIGTLVLSSLPVVSKQVTYYDGNPTVLPEIDDDHGNAALRMLIEVEIKKNDELFTFVSTHFTITHGGEVSELQRQNLQKILEILSGKEFVFAGDFNAPRGKEIWNRLASIYKDNIPAGVTTTIDRSLHRSGKNADFPDYVVDGLFTTPQYEATNVRVIDGVSDHSAILARISKRE